MLLIIKLIQKIVAALDSGGTPSQVAFGVAMGACLGLTFEREIRPPAGIRIPGP
jgi:hypothetical protein